MAVAHAQPGMRERGAFGRAIDDLNGKHHRIALWAFMAVVIAHWAEHLTQAVQIFVLGMERPDSRGVLGQFFPWLAKSETLHWGYAVVMLIGLLLLRPGFSGRSKSWWTAALAIQIWHFVEHSLLGLQYLTATPFFGKEESTSVIQLFVPRVELHLFYNVAVFIPMVIAMLYHTHPSPDELHTVTCSCAKDSREPAFAAA